MLTGWQTKPAVEGRNREGETIRKTVRNLNKTFFFLIIYHNNFNREAIWVFYQFFFSSYLSSMRTNRKIFITKIKYLKFMNGKTDFFLRYFNIKPRLQKRKIRKSAKWDNLYIIYNYIYLWNNLFICVYYFSLFNLKTVPEEQLSP